MVAENETEVSLFNREMYEQFKAHPEVRFVLALDSTVDVTSCRRSGRHDSNGNNAKQ